MIFPARLRTAHIAVAPRKCRGMTLLEILVALSIFALIGTASYRLLSSVTLAKSINDSRMERLVAAQTTMSVLGNDLMQLAARPVREEKRDLAAFMTADEEYLFQYSRFGWSNPLGAPRSDIQRVAWQIEWLDEDQNELVLVRYYWPVLDRLSDTRRFRQPMLPGVSTVSLRVMDDKKRWHQQWPPKSTSKTRSGEEAPNLDQVPRAVELKIEHSELGTITRIWAVR